MALKSKDLPLNTVAETTNTTVNLDFLEKNDKTMIDKDVDFKSVTKGDEVAPLNTEEPEEQKSDLQLQEEKVLLAGGFKLPSKPTLKDDPYGKNKKERLDKQKEILNKIEGDIEIDQATGTIILKEFDEDELKTVNNILEEFELGTIKDVSKRKSLKKIFNDLDTDINGTFKPNKFSDTVYTIFKDQIENAKGGKVNVDQLMSQAASLGRSDVYLTILNKKQGQALPLDVGVRAIMETKLLYTYLAKIADKGRKGTATEAEKIEFYKVLRLYGQILSKTAADASSAGQKLRVIQEVQKIDPSLTVDKGTAADTIKWMTDNMNADFSENGFKNISQHFLMLRPDQASKFAKLSLASKWKDGWVELWVNSRLMSPITHIVNTIGNLGFNSLRLMEYTVAATLNKIPFNGSPQGVQFNEVVAMIKALNYGGKLGMDNMVEGFKKGASNTKLDLPPRKAIGKELAGGMSDTPLGMILEYMGTAARFPGRLLVAEDEFMKGILFQVELERLATRKYNEVINAGGSKADAQAAYTKELADPSYQTVLDVKASMLEGTFQADLPPGVLKNLQSFMNIPEVKLFVPFYKTVTNIFLESSKRNPTTAFFMPSVRRDLMGANGPAKKQLAQAKILTTSFFMYQFMQYTYGAADGSSDFIITGRAPGTKKERDAFFRNGYQPYSIGFRQDDGNFKFYSFARFEPMSTFLAMAADLGYAASRPEQYGYAQDENIQAAFAAGISWMYTYMGEQPFLEGISTIAKAFNGLGSDGETKLMNGLAAISDQVMEATYGVVTNPFGTFSTYLEKMQDPTIYNTMISPEQADYGFFGFFGRTDENPDIPLPIRKFYQSLNKIHKNSPFFNPDLKPALNYWGEIMEGPEQGIINPVKIKHTDKFNMVDDWLQTYGLGIPMHPKKVGGVINLDSEQYYDYVTIINRDNDGNGYSDLLDAMQKKMESSTWQRHENHEDGPQRGKQLQMLLSVVEGFREDALKELKTVYPQISIGIENLKKKKELMGKR